MKVTAYKTAGHINVSGANIKYYVLDKFEHTNEGQFRITYPEYLNNNNAAPTISVIVYNGVLSPMYSATMGSIVEIETITEDGDTIKRYEIQPADTSINHGYYSVEYSKETTKVMVEDVDGCCTFFMDLSESHDRTSEITKENFIGHFNNHIVELGGRTFTDYHGVFYYYGIPVYNKMSLYYITPGEGLNLDCILPMFPYVSSVDFREARPLSGNIEDLADYINISSYKSKNGTYFCGMYRFEVCYLTGSWATFVNKLIARGARNFGAAFGLSYTGVQDVPSVGNGYFIMTIDGSGNVSYEAANNTSIKNKFEI